MASPKPEPKMKIHPTILYLCLWCCLAQTASAQKKFTFTLANPLPEARIDELIVLQRTAITAKAGVDFKGKLPIFRNEKGGALPSQTDDLDGDGQWDEVALLVSFGPSERFKAKVTWAAPEQMPQFPVRTQARLAKLTNGVFVPTVKETIPPGHKPTDFSTTKLPLYQVEGPTWENDKVGFRLYFDERNGKDIFGKTQPALVLDKVGLPGGDYHTKSDWGMDVLKVGASLGAGAVAIITKNDRGEETLARLGDKVGQTSYSVVCQGPVRAIFRLKYENWQVDGQENYQLVDEISIVAGQYGYESKLTLSGFAGERQLVTGIVNLYSDQATHAGNNQYALLATHAKQSENKDRLGMGIVVANADFAGYGQTPETGPEKVLQTYFVKLKVKENQSVKYRFYAGWEASDPRFEKAASFEKLLHFEAKKIFSPIKIVW